MQTLNTSEKRKKYNLKKSEEPLLQRIEWNCLLGTSVNESISGAQK